MKETGIVRKLDELGRITLPIELRRTLNIAERDSLEISVKDDMIILTKYEPVDIFNGSKDDLIEYCGKKVSKKSIFAFFLYKTTDSTLYLQRTIDGNDAAKQQNVRKYEHIKRRTPDPRIWRPCYF